ncbi:hypothetical protein BDV98DRAFT_596286 [Pterulicium gracile]|uniref:Rab-GAP TBC domain-containing protein n=1 Tax=Pterulicium gracile TaxID=1884261 RepID=A0A5C3Q858_9AGAR|nr:hypothetical protein BDV98DRAFT_596286 [Pterula gracilis]
MDIPLEESASGNMWETLPGSIDLRFSHPNYYVQLLKDGEGRMSTSTEDIEECSLELTGAYLFKNSELGYCQAMNILAAAVVMWDDFSGLIRVLVLLKHKDHTTVECL